MRVLQYSLTCLMSATAEQMAVSPLLPPASISRGIIEYLQKFAKKSALLLFVEDPTKKMASGRHPLTTEEAMLRAGKLLQVSNLDPQLKCTSKGCCQTGIVDDTRMPEPKVTCPGISLYHENHFSHEGRKKTEDYAVELLSRTISSGINSRLVERANAENPHVMQPQLESIAAMGEKILHNTCESFSTLVNSRLRAYVSFLAKHGTSNVIQSDVESVEQKLSLLLSVGMGIKTTQVSSRWDVSDLQDSRLGNQSRLPVDFSVTMMVAIPSINGPEETIRLTFSTSGDMTATCTEGKTTAIKIALDTRALLAEMMERASCVVAIVVDVANNVLCIPAPLQNPARGDSFLVMPPPAPQQHKSPRGKKHHNPLEILSKVATDFRIVSPDIKAMSQLPSCIPPFKLDGSVDSHSQDVSQMSADQCATIVDDVLESLDGDLFAPVTKRAKLT